MPSVQLKVKGTVGVLEDKHMLKEAAAGSQLYWSQIWSCQQGQASALLWCFRKRMMLAVRGLLVLLKLLAFAFSPLPLEQFQHLPIPLGQLLAGCRLCIHTSPDHTNLTSCSPGHHPFTRVTPVETPVFRTNVMRLWLAGTSNDSPWSLPRVNRALPAFKDTKLSFSHHPWKNVQCSWSHPVFAGVRQKMSSTLCYRDTWGHLFCIVMERAFLVSRMLAAVTSNPESGLFDQCKPLWTWNLTFCLCVAQDEIQFGEKKRIFILINSKNYLGTLSMFSRFIVTYGISNDKIPSSSRTRINKLQCHFPLQLETTVPSL